MHITELGSSGPRVSRIGLGCMGMSDLYGPADRAESIATIHASKDRAGEADFRGRMSPRFAPDNLDNNLALVERMRGIADEKGATVAQLAIGWVLAHGADIMPLIGARRRDRLREALGALSLELTPADLARLEAAVPPQAVAGERYHPSQMAHLDSELG
jgi:pyridoxine 4-dehydrogenase